MNEEMNEQSSKTLASPKLSKVVLIVLAAHVVLILGFGIYCLLKGNTNGKGDADVAANGEAANTEQVASSGSAQPTLETNAPEVTNSVSPVTQETVANSQATTTGSSMPNTQDPVWNRPANGNNRPVVQTAAPVQQQVVRQTAPVVQQQTPAATTPSAGTYAVQKGDSLYKIARNHNVTVPELKQANGLTSDALKIGQMLNIPGKGSAAPASTSTAAVVANSQPTPAVTASTPTVVHAAVANSNAAAFQNYKVAPGDTLWKISKKFNTTTDAIAKANNLSDPSKLKVGMEIKVPSQTRETAQPAAQPQAVIPNVDVAVLPHNRG